MFISPFDVSIVGAFHSATWRFGLWITEPIVQNCLGPLAHPPFVTLLPVPPIFTAAFQTRLLQWYRTRTSHTPTHFHDAPLRHEVSVVALVPTTRNGARGPGCCTHSPMPPLQWLRPGNMQFCPFGGIYILYTINCAFIGTSTFHRHKFFFKHPRLQLPDSMLKEQSKQTWWQPHFLAWSLPGTSFCTHSSYTESGI